MDRSTVVGRRLITLFPLWVMGGGGVFGTAQPIVAQELQLAELGECHLESGEAIVACVVGYRTAGELNEDASNAVLFPAWGNGTSGQLFGPYIGGDAWIDPDDYFVIAVDLFGNGVSSSPSNSREQPGEAFPHFNIRDMVRAQHRLVTEVLGLDGLYAVIGISWGGFVAFEWTTTFPGFVANAVPVVATPQPSPWDLLMGHLRQRILEGCGLDHCEEARATYYAFFQAMVRSPEHRNRTLSPDAVSGYVSGFRQAAEILPPVEDMLAQGAAAQQMDITEPFGGSMEAAAQAAQSRMLIVVATHDLLVTPEAPREFAGRTGARLLELEGDCGHQAFVCEDETVSRAIRDFLR
jgi:homoserine O-acetyltransferase/O-succinyltransferase